MALPVFDTITNFFLPSALTKLNGNFDVLSDYLEQLINKDGSLNMTGDLDMNSRQLINLADATSDNQAATLGQVKEIPKGDKGEPGAAGNVADSLAVFRASETTNVSMIYNGAVWNWTAGNFTARVAADTQNGIYISSLVPGFGASVGAWVRQLPAPGYWHADWFGIPDDPAAGQGTGSEIQCHNEMSAMINIANIVKPTTIEFGSKIYTLGAQIPEFNFQVNLIGGRGFQGTIICKRYNEASPTRGILAFNDYGFTTEKITIRSGVGSWSGGSAISATLTKVQPADGRTYILDTYVSVGASCNHSLYINGMTNTSVGGPGYRGVYIRGGEFFGAALSSVKFHGVHHVLMAGTLIMSAGGSPGSKALDSDGTSSVYNDDWQMHGFIAGLVNLVWLGRSVFVSPQSDSITVDANTTTTQWVGPRISGVITSSAGTGFTTSWDGLVVASGGNSTAGWRRWGSGKIEQWGSAITSSGIIADQTLPVAFTSTNIQYSGQRPTDAGANLISIIHMYPGTTPTTQYTVKAAVLNYSAIAVGASSTAVRWSASGQ